MCGVSPAPNHCPQVFKLFDDDNSACITFKNLQRVARELGENLTDDELQEMVDEADRDGVFTPNYIIYSHPIAYVGYGADPLSCRSWSCVCLAGDGVINEEEFYRVMKKRGDNPLDELSSDEDEF